MGRIHPLLSVCMVLISPRAAASGAEPARASDVDSGAGAGCDGPIHDTLEVLEVA